MHAPPVIEKFGDEVNISWPKLKVGMQFREFRKTPWALMSEVTVMSMIPGADYILGPREIRIKNGRDMDELTRRLSHKVATVNNWEDLIEEGCRVAVQRYLSEEESRDFADLPNPGPPRFLIPAFLQADANNILAAARGSLKSYVALGIAVSVATGRIMAGGIIDASDPGPVLYLDWEDTPDTQAARFAAVCRGFGFSELPRSIRYRRMRHSIFESATEIRREVDRYEARLVIVDSIGVASRGDINAADLAIKAMSECCSSWAPATRLIIGHNPKTDRNSRPEDRSTIGSQFFESDARCVWQAQGDTADGSAVREVGLWNTKMSNAAKPHPIGLRITFEENPFTVYFDEADVSSNPELGRYTGIQAQVKTCIEQSGEELTIAEIADETGLEKRQVQVALRELVKRGLVLKLNDRGRGTEQVFVRRADTNGF